MAMKEFKRTRSVDSVELTETLVLTRTRAQDLENVKKLNCWASNIGDVSVVRRMPNLEVCSLSINKLTTLRDFAHCHHLQELYVRTNQIEQLGDIHYLKNLKKLRSLWLSENPCASGVNYRMTVLKTLPNLHKLDNVVVTEDEVMRAKKEGGAVPVPEDFSASSLFDQVAASSEDQVKERKSSESSSVSSDKWALPRRKRQQRKREDLERERKSYDEESGSARSGDDGGGGGPRHSSDSSGSRGKPKSYTEGSKISPRSDDTGNEDDDNDEDDKDGNTDKKNCDNSSLDEEHDVASNTAARAKWAISVGKSDVFQPNDNDLKKAENNDDFANVEKSRISDHDGDDRKSREMEQDGDINRNKLTALKGSLTKNVFPQPEKISTLEFFQLSSGDEKMEISSVNASESTTLTSQDDRQRTEASFLHNSENIVAASISSSIITNESNNSMIYSSSSHVAESETSQNYSTSVQNMFSSFTNASKDREGLKSQNPLLDKIRLEDSLDVQESTEDGKLSDANKEIMAFSMLSCTGAGNVQSGVSHGKNGTSTDSTESNEIKVTALPAKGSKQPVNWEEYNRLRIQLGVKPVDRIPNTGRSANSEVTRARNSNILQAVLCLVKELDKDSLDIVASAVKGRLDSMG